MFYPMSRSKGGASHDDGPSGTGEHFHGPGPRVHGILQGWILLFLAERENYGYRLVRQVAEELPKDMIPDPAVIYRMLRTLEREGAVASTLQAGSGGPARKVYRITDAGRARLEAWRDTASSRMEVLRRFIARVSDTVDGG